METATASTLQIPAFDGRNITPSQRQAFVRLLRYIEDEQRIYGQEVKRAVTETSSYEIGGELWLRFSLERLDLPENNALRFVDYRCYQVAIGKKGKITLINYPDSLKQFKGKKFLGMWVK